VGDPSPLVRRVLGRYALYDKIASGGMASVHLGRLIGSVGFTRTVAIKRLHAQYAEDPEFVSMFLDEARLVARISHPNVIPTLDVVHTGGELFLVMEYVRGETLSRLIRAAIQRQSQMPPAMAATILVGVLHGLHAAHEAKSERGEPLGIVHRDVSPQNVLIGVDGIPRVLDFGVAKAKGRIQTTREGQLKGKLAYMSPEQVSGVTTRATDIYAASIVLWETLTGRRLFSGENEAQVLDRVLKGVTMRPSAFVPGLPPSLDLVTLRGLSLAPNERYATARDMARALEDALPLVSASKIGEWVESAAKEKLDQRNQQIEAIESSSWTQAPASLGAVRTQTRLSTRTAGEDARRSNTPAEISIETEDFAELSGDSVSAAARASEVSGSAAAREGSTARRRPIALMTLGGALAVGAVGAVVALSSHFAKLADVQRLEAASSSPLPPTGGTDSAQASSSGLPPVRSPTPSAAPTATSTPSTAAVSPPRASAAAPPSAGAGSSAGSRHHTAPAPVDSCTPPFYFNEEGVRVFKKGCL
jgi:eukaryotic-like serine/threonine-protein kinase